MPTIEEDIKVVIDFAVVLVKIRHAFDDNLGVTLTAEELRSFLSGLKLAIQ